MTVLPSVRSPLSNILVLHTVVIQCELFLAALFSTHSSSFASTGQSKFSNYFAMAQSRRIVVLGSLNTDLVTVTSRIPLAGETFTAISFSTGPGGKGQNQAVGCARAATNAESGEAPIQVAMLGATGTSEHDQLSDALHATLKAEGIDASGIERIPHISSGTATILVEEQTGQNRILVVPGANGKVNASFLQKPIFKSKLWGDSKNPKASLLVLQLEIPLETVVEAISQAKSHGIPVLLNPAPAISNIPRETLRDVDHLIVNETEAQILLSNHDELVGLEITTKDWLHQVFLSFAKIGVKNLVVTLGEKGACYTSSSDQGYDLVSAIKVPAEDIVDTTAAGDTFVGVYAVEVVKSQGKELNLRKAIEQACKASALTVQKAGAIQSIPYGRDY